MRLKYKWHRKIMVWTRFAVVLYSALVFLLLINLHSVEYFLRTDLVIVLFSLFWVFIFFSCFFDANLNLLLMWFIRAVPLLVLFMILISIAFFDGFFSGYQITIWKTFLLFVVLVCIYILSCLFVKKQIKKNSLLVIYFVFYSIFLFPVLLEVISDVNFIWKFWNLLFWLSPLLLFFFRSSLADFIWSWLFVRKIFTKKDLLVWTCPICRKYILSKPIRFCPRCGNDKRKGQCLHFYCTCWFFMKVGDFDFPNHCPHCGVPLRKIKIR